jgi:hypothetical protein
MKKFFGSFIFSLAIVFFSCEKQDLLVRCSECTETEPENAELKIKLDLDHNYQTRINIYEGNLEDSILYKTFTTDMSQATISVVVNKEYTLEAIYHISHETYIAIDKVRPQIRYDKTQCDNPCYYVYNKTVNLKIKYYNR